MDALTQYFPDLETWRGPLVSVLHVVLILVLAWLALRVSRRALARVRMHLQQDLDDSERIKRLNTLEQVLRYVLAVLIILVAGMLVLSELGISIAPVLAAAGVVGIAVGFGAQSLVKDYFTGLFLLLENQVRQGDVVEVGGKGGLVEEMTLRYIRLRDYEGSVHYVPNGIIDTVTNRSRGFAFALIDVSVAYREDVDAVCAVMREVAAELRADPELSSKVVEDIEIAGVEQWADSAVVIRCRFKTLPLEQWNVRRAYLQRLKKAFDAADIEIPFPHLTLYQGQNKDGNAPPLRLAPVEGLREAASTPAPEAARPSARAG